MAAIAECVNAYAVSPLQHGMLFHFLERGPHTGCDIQQLDVTFRETVEVPTLVRAWQLVAARHPVLRTRFRWKEVDRPQQEVVAALDLPIEWHDLSSQPVADQSAAVAQFLATDRLRGFDLSTAPLWRVTIFSAGGRGQRMVWTYSHTLLDGCYAEVIGELFDAYDALGGEVTPRFPDRPSYRDHIAWLQSDWSARATAARGFWRERLKGFAKPTTLDALRRTDTAPGRVASAHQTLRCRLEPATSAALHRMCDVHGLHVSACVHAAWALVLGAFSGEDDVVFGETRRCRHSSIPGADSIVGLLINTVPVRANITGARPLLALLHDLDRDRAAVGPFEHTPLAEAAACSEVPRGTGLFDTAVVIDERDDRRRSGRSGPLTTARLALHTQTSLAITVSAVLDPSIVFHLSFDPGRLECSDVRRLATLLKRLLHAMAERPEVTVAELPRLPTRDERALAAFNQTAVTVSGPGCVHQAVEAQVDRRPDIVAVICGRESLTYRELDERANRVAHDLVARGVAPDQTVGVFVDRSLEMVIGLLGILKAGGAYVPLEPSYPRERIAIMLEDARPRVVVTVDRLRSALPAAEQVVTLESYGRDRRRERIPTPVRPDHLAYVIFTSGSTGRPKGVQVEHRNVINCFCAIDGVLGTTPGVWLALAGISFDISVLELFWTLARGFTVVLQEETARSTPASGGPARPLGSFSDVNLLAQVRRHGVTHLQCTPSLLEQISIEAGSGEALGALRDLLVGGEALPAALVDQIAPHLTGTLHNMYGPTETTIWSTAAIVDPGQPITIGRNIANTTIHIRDRASRPVPIGVAGELLIGGAGVTRGYLGMPDLTNERFVHDPHTGQRLYRTGDLAAWRPDGQLTFLGRIDHQVKIRGNRVEPGEIDSVIAQHPSVRECVTVAQSWAPGDVRLVAHVVPRSTEDLPRGSAPSSTSAGSGGLPAALRRYASTRLPAFMVPSAVVLLSAIPLTPNGKVNRSVLASTAESDSQVSGLVPPNDRERAIVAVIGDLVGCTVGVDDNFFDLGLHSLLMIQASWRLEVRLGRPVAIVQIVRHPTARALAAALTEADADKLTIDHSLTRAHQRQQAIRRRRGVAS